MPQRTGLPGLTNPFGSSVFSTNWLANRERANTLQSIRPSDAASSPREPSADNDVRTLDYLGLVDNTPQGGNPSGMGPQRPVGPTIADLAALNAFNSRNIASRFRSYSVNAKEKYADGEDDEMDQYEQLQAMYSSRQFNPSESTAAQAAAILEAVRQHNLEVQAFENNLASANRPRARTAGVLDSLSSRVLRPCMPTPSRLDSSITAADLQSNDGSEMTGMRSAMHGMGIGSKQAYDSGMDAGPDHPTRSLWLGNIPSSTTVSSLNVIFSQFGSIEFARVLTHKNCGFVNFENVQSAIGAKAQYNGKEIFPGCGPVRVGYAKEQSTANTPRANGTYPSPSPDPFVSKGREDGAVANAGPAVVNNINAETAAAALVTPNLTESRDEILNTVQQFGASPDESARIAVKLDRATVYKDYRGEIPPVIEPTPNRLHDAPRLREIRKRIDNNSCSPAEIENIAMEMLSEIAELSSDYLGNTVVQKLFERCTEEAKQAMLGEIAPHLAEIGVHKNGTWAAQKIIDVARTPTQMSTIVGALRPHGVNLFLDQYGNYVMQCCLRFQTPLNDFVFDTMASRLWDVAQGRFGARAMRACLESHFATSDQRRLMAATIALHSVQLATNSNGALLLTWFLDTCTFPKRRSVLAPRLISHLVHLCTHKVAYLTVLKIINQRGEPEARDSILRALFFDDQTLIDITTDQACGSTLIFKVLTTPFLDGGLRSECIEHVRNVLIRIKAQPNQGYKRLMDEVGLSTKHSGPPNTEARPGLKTRGSGSHPQQIDTNQTNFGRPPFVSPQQHHQMENQGLQRRISMDSSTFDTYGAGYGSPHYAHSPAMSNAAMSPVIPPQLQYQQAMMQAQQDQMQRPPGFYGSPPVSTMPNGMAYATSSPGPQMADPYRTGSPMVPHGAGFPQQSYGPPIMGTNGYGQYQMPPQYYQQHPQMQVGQGRRGRVSRSPQS